MKKPLPDAGATDQQNKSRQPANTKSDDSEKNIGNRQAAAIGSEESMARRETTVTAREEVTHAREETADQREDVAKVREQEVHLREIGVASREKETVEISSKDLEDKELEHANNLASLRDVNERLVITAVHSQMLTEEVQLAKDQMGHMAQHDFLTGLPNRILLEERLIQALALAKRHGTKLAILFVDLDRFKTINDSLGHAVGDRLLKSVAQRLTSAIRSSDTVSRQGGDEFVALLSEVADEDAVAVLADKICKAVTAPYRLAEQDLHIGVTIGISVYPDDGEEPETLIRHADVAMYHGKTDGGDRYQFFRPEMNARAIERQEIEGDLRLALERKEFQLYYQAQVALQTGGIIGVEALIRWHHPVRGLLLPGVFMPIAEACGVIVPIGRWVLREACRQTQAWLDAGLALQVVAVNISAMEFKRDDFLVDVRAALHDANLASHHLELELTETVLMKNAESTLPMLQEFKSMGIKIAIDDFGTGYSSLRYLKQFPFDTLKIDQTFIAGIASDNDDDILVDAVIGLGKSLGHRVIAEGIETRDQLTFLSTHHCAEGQGYYLSRPLPADQLSALLQTGVSPELFPRA